MSGSPTYEDYVAKFDTEDYVMEGIWFKNVDIKYGAEIYFTLPLDRKLKFVRAYAEPLVAYARGILDPDTIPVMISTPKIDFSETQTGFKLTIEYDGDIEDKQAGLYASQVNVYVYFRSQRP